MVQGDTPAESSVPQQIDNGIGGVGTLLEKLTGRSISNGVRWGFTTGTLIGRLSWKGM